MIERELELQDFELQELEQEEPCGNPHERHRERLRARYREQGVDRFNDYELLEMLLGYVLLQKDTNGIAHELINAFGSLQGVLDAPEEKLTEINQVGPNVAFMLRLLPGIARRYGTSSSKVERAMRHAIEVAWNRGRLDVTNQLLGVTLFNERDKPTNGEFISLIAAKAAGE